MFKPVRDHDVVKKNGDTVIGLKSKSASAGSANKDVRLFQAGGKRCECAPDPKFCAIDRTPPVMKKLGHVNGAFHDKFESRSLIPTLGGLDVKGQAAHASSSSTQLAPSTPISLSLGDEVHYVCREGFVIKESVGEKANDLVERKVSLDYDDGMLGALTASNSAKSSKFEYTFKLAPSMDPKGARASFMCGEEKQIYRQFMVDGKNLKEFEARFDADIGRRARDV